MKTFRLLVFASLAAMTLACGYSSKNMSSTAGAVPAISTLNPNSMTAGSAAFTMTINGSNFGTKAVVNWNGAAQTANTTYVTGNQLMVTIPASMIADSGMVQVTVTNPATGGIGMYGTGATMAETSSPMTFTIN